MLNNEIITIQDLFSSNKILYNSNFVMIDFVNLKEDLPTDAKGRFSWRSVEARTNNGEAVPTRIRQGWGYGQKTLDKILITKVRREGNKIFLVIEDEYLGHIGEIQASSFIQGNFKTKLNSLYNEKCNIHNKTIREANVAKNKAEEEERMAKDQLAKMVDKVHKMEMELNIKNVEIDKLNEDVKDANYRKEQAERGKERAEHALREVKTDMAKLEEEHKNNKKHMIQATIQLLKKVGNGYSPMKAIAEFTQFFKEK